MKYYTGLITFLIFICSGTAKADSYANTIKVECVPELSSFSLSFQRYFGKAERDFAVNNTFLLAEKYGIYVLEDLLTADTPSYKSECVLNGNQLQLIVEVADKKEIRRNYCDNDLNVLISLKNNGKIILNKVSSLQCYEAQNIDRILLYYGLQPEDNSMRVNYITYKDADKKSLNCYGYKDIDINTENRSLNSNEFWKKITE